MEDILIGVTDRSIPIWIPDPASTTGAGKTGLLAAAITVTYTRYETDNDVVHNDVTSSVNDLTALTDAHTDWGWKEVSSTLSKGQYRLDLADAVFASGAWYTVVQVTITSGTAAATPKEFRLVSRNDLDGVRLGLTALPNAAADAAGGLPISDAGGLDLDSKLANTNEVTVARMGALTDWINGGRLDLILDIIAADTTTDIPALLSTLQTSVNDLPTNAELATALAAADDAILAAIAALNNLSAAQVNAEVLDVLNVDTFAQPGQGTPAATNTIRAMLAYLFKAWRNRTTQTASEYALYNDDAATVDHKAAFSDDGTTADRQEITTGP